PDIETIRPPSGLQPASKNGHPDPQTNSGPDIETIGLPSGLQPASPTTITTITTIITTTSPRAPLLIRCA
ncbi:MAG: hypothetical protein K8963_08645, partial [Proteobacteria bacterium]|nr:hypothetical protein [Pseudomonadota bacterium]